MSGCKFCLVVSMSEKVSLPRSFGKFEDPVSDRYGTASFMYEMFAFRSALHWGVAVAAFLPRGLATGLWCPTQIELNFPFFPFDF